MIQSLGRLRQSKTGAASLTQLPPSPETSSLASMNDAQPSTISLGATILEESAASRLRSVATYKKFHPQAIACSPPTFRPDGRSAQLTLLDDYSSLGAISGDDGIALFRTSRPDVPLLMLSHSSMVGRLKTGAIQNLAFEPKLTDSILLAASRGNGLLIWDASGHSLSPLMGRLAVDMVEKPSSLHDIRSMAWKTTDGGHSMIAIATSSYTCLWDLRASLGSKTSKPSLRFASLTNSSPLIQVACSHKDECATMDSSGLIRVYDLRMTGGTKPRLLSSVPSFHFAGAGLASFRTSTDDSYWVAWGLDSPKADAIVKIWSTSVTSGKIEVGDSDSDTYWYMDGSPERTPQIPLSESSPQVQTCVQMAQFTMPYLACARICPAPFENSVVTVGLAKGGGPGWKAELWKLNIDDDDASESTDTFGVQKMVSFSGDRSFNFGMSMPPGPLRGAELAISQAPLPISRAQQRGPSLADDDWELLLCCMSEDGLITTSVVAESPSANIAKSSVDIAGPRFGMRSLRYIPNERRGNSTVDAVSALKSIGDSGQVRQVPDESKHAFAHQSLDPISSPPSPGRNNDKPPDVLEQSKIPGIIRGEGNPMPFDMDVGFVPIAVEPTSVGATSVVSAEVEDVEFGVQPSRLTKRIITDHVPCPRLCGATFSPGIGGLVGFNNGEINKMWTWYIRNEIRRKSSGLNSASDTTKENSSYPRLKKDLDDMTTAAKDAQWGENHEDQGAADNESEGSIDDLFEDLSSEDDGDINSIAPSEQNPETLDDVYQAAFGGSQKLNLRSSTIPLNNDIDEAVSKKSSAPKEDTDLADDTVLTTQDRLGDSSSFDGPTSDVLAPVVRIWYDTDEKMFNGQTVQLAENLLLGDWEIVAETAVLDDGSTEEESIGMNSESNESDVTSPRRSIPNFRHSVKRPIVGSMLPPVDATSVTISSAKPDPSIQWMSNLNLSSDLSRARDDDPVHGGKYGVRPRREESMLILKKLLPTPYHSLISPPDSHLLHNKLQASSGMKRSASSGAIMQSVRNTLSLSPSDSQARMGSGQSEIKPNVGVFTMPTQQTAALRSASESLLKLICIYNSNVCLEFGQHEKANTWSILPHAVENHLLDTGCNDSFSGWGGTEIGRELVTSLLRYYESEGDIQMVASMICVLKTGYRGDSCHRFTSLLPADQNDKYDLYIQRYAELVFRWGLLTKRVELLKHLSRHSSSPDRLQLPSSSAVINTVTDAPTKYGISFGGSCQRCGGAVSTSDSNICSNCHDCAFRCILCDNAVRGLCTVCPLCGHGGHLNHIMQWFETATKCPTGCGCECVLTSSSVSDSRDSPSIKLAAAEEPEILAVQQRIQQYSVF